MASAHAKAQARAFQIIRKTAGVTVTYSRSASSVVITAVPGTTMMETIDDQGSMLKVKVRDYRVLASDLIIDGDLVEPERGDQISEVIGATRFIHEVIGPAGQQHVRWSAMDGSVLRIHTKLFEREAVTTTTTVEP